MIWSGPSGAAGSGSWCRSCSARGGRGRSAGAAPHLPGRDHRARRAQKMLRRLRQADGDHQHRGAAAHDRAADQEPRQHGADHPRDGSLPRAEGEGLHGPGARPGAPGPDGAPAGEHLLHLLRGPRSGEGRPHREPRGRGVHGRQPPAAREPGPGDLHVPGGRAGRRRSTAWRPRRPRSPPSSA